MTPHEVDAWDDVSLRPGWAEHQLTLIDLVDRVLAGGVTVSGDIILSVAGVDLVIVSLRALIASVETALGTHSRVRPEAGMNRSAP